MPKKSWRLSFLREAAKRLYSQDKHLIVTGQETAATTALAGHLKSALKGYLRNFPGVHVDGPYGREGTNAKRDARAQRVVPDLIVHTPGVSGPNIAVIEVKGHWNREDRARDVAKLRGYLRKQRYWRAYAVELMPDKAKIVRVQALKTTRQ